MKILLAGPGTGKTTKIKKLIKNDFDSANNILVLSFTNATVDGLNESFKKSNNVKCYTLHSFALKINHLPDRHVLTRDEGFIIKDISTKISVPFYELCNFINCMTYDYMISSCISFLDANPAYAKENIGDLDLLIVDEFQDFNETERRLVFKLDDYSQETFILGDDDQSIYGFKDADPEGIIDLYNDQNIGKIEHENICYRCPDVVVEHCKKLIGLNKNRVEKKWIPNKNEGDTFFYQHSDHKKTHEFLLEKIQTIKEQKPKDSILVLSPVGFYIPELITLLEENQVDYLDFWKNYLEPSTQEKIWWLNAIYGNNKLLYLLFLLRTLKSHQKSKLLSILLERLKENFDEQELINVFVKEKFFLKPFSDYLTDSPELEDFFNEHEEYIELQDFIKEENLIDSLKHIERNINPPTIFDNKSVNIMSIHKSKGLQADHVFILGLTEGVIPNDARGLDSLEAYRRLLFVGMSRSLKTLHLISTVGWEGKYVNKVDKSKFKYNYVKKLWYGKTSRFIEEIQT